METWLRSGACQYVGKWSTFHDKPNLQIVNTVLPVSVERSKPRICTDGGCLKAISPKKIPCELDEVVKALKFCKKDSLFYSCKKSISARAKRHPFLVLVCPPQINKFLVCFREFSNQKWVGGNHGRPFY